MSRLQKLSTATREVMFIGSVTGSWEEVASALGANKNETEIEYSSALLIRLLFGEKCLVEIMAYIHW